MSNFKDKNVAVHTALVLFCSVLLVLMPRSIVAQSEDSLYAEISIHQQLQTTFSRIVDDDTLFFVRPGETYTCRFTVENADVFTPDSILLYAFLPPHTKVAMQHESSYFEVIDDSILVWHPFTLEPGEFYADSLQISVRDSLVWSDFELLNTLAADIVFEGQNYLCYPSDESAYLATDLAVYQSSGLDTSAMGAGLWVYPDEEFYHSIEVCNFDNVPAYHVSLTSILPESLSIVEYLGEPPLIIDQNKLVWEFEELAPWSAEKVTFRVRAPQTVSESGAYLVSEAQIDALNNDLLFLSDDVAHDTVFVSSSYEFTDIAVTQDVRTEQFELVEQDTIWSVRAGETYLYRFKIENLTETPAYYVTLYDILPDSTYIRSEDLVTEMYGDTLVWYFSEVAPMAAIEDSFKVTVFDQVEDDSTLFINTMFVSASNEDSSALDNNLSVHTMRLWKEKPFSSAEGELVLSSNIFRADGMQEPLLIYFDLQQEHSLQIDLVDISGYKIETLVSDHFAAGQHRFSWDGLLDNGQMIGSGVYVLTLLSDDNELTSWKKFIIQR